MTQKARAILLAITILFSCDAVERATVHPETDTPPGHFQEDFFRYHDYTYADYIRSVMLHKEGFALSMPVIRLGSKDKLLLRFDDLDGGVKQYHYQIIHCDANWRRSTLTKAQYNQGHETGLIENYEFSYNTLESFTHYWLRFPGNDAATPTVSGNYIITVFEAGQQDKPILSRRFMVFETGVDIDAQVVQATPPNKRQTHQQLDFTISTGNLKINNPERNLKVMVMQNQRWDNIIENIQPRNIRNDFLDYRHTEAVIFSGTNEFRSFDIRSLRRSSPRISSIDREGPRLQVFLQPDYSRAMQPYVRKGDLNGKFYIVSYDVNREKELESDYALVHFFLPWPDPIAHGSVYIMGEISNWQFQEKTRMRYDGESGGYRCSLYLKQGYYDYHYVLLPNNSQRGNAAYFEGEHAQAENDYTIFVYYRRDGGLYDKLVGVDHINSTE